MKYLAIGTNSKTVKSDKSDQYLTAIMYLAPDAGGPICPASVVANCHAVCLRSAGRAAIFETIPRARARKTAAFLADPVAFVDQLKKDTMAGIRKATRLSKKLAVRLNGTSDIAWENLPGSDGQTLMQAFPDVQWYDYTKLAGRQVPSNYTLVASYSAANAKYSAKILKSPLTLSVVFLAGTMPATWQGRQVIDGDNDDLIFLHPAGCVIGLKPKGQARKATAGGLIVDGRILATA